MAIFNKTFRMFLCCTMATVFFLKSMQKPLVVITTKPCVNSTVQALKLENRMKMLALDDELSKNDLHEALIALHRETSDSLCDCLDQSTIEPAFNFLQLKHHLEKEYPYYLAESAFVSLRKEHERLSDLFSRLHTRDSENMVQLLDLHTLLMNYTIMLETNRSVYLAFFQELLEEISDHLDQKLQEQSPSENFLEDVD